MYSYSSFISFLFKYINDINNSYRYVVVVSKMRAYIYYRHLVTTMSLNTAKMFGQNIYFNMWY